MTSFDYDPDKLYLTKEQIISVGDKLISRWQQNATANRKIILITRAAQWFARRYSEQEIEQYYKEFLIEVFEIMQQNALKGDPQLSTLNRVAEARAAAATQGPGAAKPKVITTTKKSAPLDFTKSLGFGAMRQKI